VERRAEIAGAGFAGLTLATLLAERGWSVRVHERAERVREIGAGIFVHSNGLYVLEALGLMARLAERGAPLQTARVRDERGRALQDVRLEGPSRMWSFPRQAIIEELHAAALARGVEVRTGQTVQSAEPEGWLILEGGTRLQADLVVGADGHRSRVRDSLGLTMSQGFLSTTSTRYLLSGRDFAPEPATTEHWSGRRRIALAACGPMHTYIYMACPQSDERGAAQPLDVESWSASFPKLRPVFETLARNQSIQAPYSYARCTRWSRGRAAVVGDAAHAMAPTLGQAANLAMSNAWCLAARLEDAPDIPAALVDWERRVRWVTDSTQKWARRYDAATKYWPAWLSPARAAVIRAFGWPFLSARMRVADHNSPHTLIARST
jgi:2-polyprenyl-6-methoxyphenol hydroxylase-like FAD-dependent oxidoreductase